MIFMKLKFSNFTIILKSENMDSEIWIQKCEFGNMYPEIGFLSVGLLLGQNIGVLELG